MEIVAHVQRSTKKIDALISKTQAAIEKLLEYRVALIVAAISGQIDVRNVSLPATVETEAPIALEALA
ncbi:hypothetical protein [Azohydromonas caseinilytica]|uniref:Uncharacterized protein n=1 Tax=Azohydromonas caseinilytica TaxID=2728836 RepID=A0A848FN61_9BURK|nr:hypothetical protein [Azohydromonas caseinilytica]NML19151.1 hypothetical protein [Azohydromonas caseinilytica]